MEKQKNVPNHQPDNICTHTTWPYQRKNALVQNERLEILRHVQTLNHQCDELPIPFLSLPSHELLFLSENVCCKCEAKNRITSERIANNHGVSKVYIAKEM